MLKIRKISKVVRFVDFCRLKKLKMKLIAFLCSAMAVGVRNLKTDACWKYEGAVVEKNEVVAWRDKFTECGKKVRMV